MTDPATPRDPANPAHPATRYRCTACGNLTRFDVVATRQTRAFHHYTIGGELTVEEEDELASTVEAVTCRWCGASGEAIEEVPVTPEPAGDDPARADQS